MRYGTEKPEPPLCRHCSQPTVHKFSVDDASKGRIFHIFVCQSCDKLTWDETLLKPDAGG